MKELKWEKEEFYLSLSVEVNERACSDHILDIEAVPPGYVPVERQNNLKNSTESFIVKLTKLSYWTSYLIRVTDNCDGTIAHIESSHTAIAGSNTFILSNLISLLL